MGQPKADIVNLRPASSAVLEVTIQLDRPLDGLSFLSVYGSAMNLGSRIERVEGKGPAGQTANLTQVAPGEFKTDVAATTFTYQVRLTTPPASNVANVSWLNSQHGLLMLAGGGIYRLDEYWYPTKAGDFIWMAPYCPQWFVAIGKTSASYIYYKDVNRAPM